MGALHRDVLRLLALGGLHFGFLLVLLLPASQASGWMNFHIEDAGLYSGFADHLAERGLLQDSSDLHEYARSRMPGYPLLLLGLRSAAASLNVSVGALATIVNVVFLLAAALFIHRSMLNIVGDRTIAFVGAASVLVTPGIAPYVFAHMPESMTLFLWSAAAWCLTLRNRSLAPWGAGVLVGIATLTKPVTLVVALAAIPALAFCGKERRPRRAVLFSLGLAPLPALWVLRNWLVWGAAVMTPNSGTHLYDYLRVMLRQQQGVAVADSRLPSSPAEWKSQFGFEFDNFGKRAQLLGSLATEEILSDPLGYAKLSAAKQPRLYVGAGAQALYAMSIADAEAARSAAARPGWVWDSGWWVYQGFSGMLLGLGYALALFGAIRGLGDRRLRPMVLVCLAAIILQAAVIGPFGHTRYRFLMTPFIGILAAVGIARSRSGERQVVAMDHLLPARTRNQVRQLRGRTPHDSPRLVGGVVRKSAGEFAEACVLDGHDVSERKLAFDIDDSDRQQALSAARQRSMGAGVHNVDALRLCSKADPTLP